MKRIIAIILCCILCILLTGCTQVSKPENSTTHTYTYAMIVMPDGSIIKGECSAFTRISSGFAMITIDGVKYYTNEWRIVLWE
jgi:uncharacterized protein YceK